MGHPTSHCCSSAPDPLLAHHPGAAGPELPAHCQLAGLSQILPHRPQLHRPGTAAWGAGGCFPDTAHFSSLSPR